MFDVVVFDVFSVDPNIGLTSGYTWSIIEHSHFARLRRFYHDSFYSGTEDNHTDMKAMPEIARFYGIVVKLFFGDHSPPHFHAVYGEHVGLFNIDTLELMEGDLPSRAEKLILEWASVNQNELKQMWESQEFHKLPPLN